MSFAVVWRGIGATIVLFVYLSLSYIVNYKIFKNYDVNLAPYLNWWWPALVCAPLAVWLDSYCRKMWQQGPVTWKTRFLSDHGLNQYIFFIRLKYWGAIFLGFALWQLWEKWH